MSTDSDNSPHRPGPHLSALSPSGAISPVTGSEAPAPGRAEAQLRARVEQLEAALADTVSCLEDAERRAAELLATRARVEALENELAAAQHRLSVVVTSKSWRLTTPLRRTMARARPSARP